MTLVLRQDRSRLGKVERTPQGGARIPGVAARVGILEYMQPDGSVVREYNPPEVLRAALDSLRDAPVTNEHPPRNLTPETIAQYSRGHLSGEARFNDATGEIEILAVVQDGQLLSDIEQKRREELSAGYSADVDYTPGETPDGQKYDGIRREIVFNHVAVVTAGRAGRNVRLRLDSAGHQVCDQETPSVKLNINGKEYEVADAQPAIIALETQLEATVAQLNTAKAETGVAQAALVEATKPEKVDALVKERVKLAQDAIKVLGDEFKTDGKSDLEIQTAVAAKAYPALKMDGRDPISVRTLYECAVSAADADPDGMKRMRETTPPTVKADSKEAPKLSAADQARKDMRADSDSGKSAFVTKDKPAS